MTSTLRRVIPAPVKRVLKQAQKAALVAQAKRDMRTLRREYADRFGPDFEYRVDDRDEMFLFMQDFWSWEHHVVPMRSPADAFHTYLVSGEGMLRDLEGILKDHGRDLSSVDSVLEFAAGYGRFTRFLVTQVSPDRVTVSDISRPAVDFSQQTFGVSGFYSTESAADLDHEGRYEVIFVASLFSHLAIEHWTDWLARLYSLLAPGGLLVFSTHGPHARDVIYGEHWSDRLETKADGFSYLLTNETEGRLAPDYYGSAFVTEEFVRSEVAAHDLGSVTRVYPHTMWKSQDVYVVEKPGPAR